ncbi:MAG: hypothetical protein HQK49_10580 [Oligoflexia bacterium]|nr:hypothetical protein [Oligoflexia bacterium]
MFFLLNFFIYYFLVEIPGINEEISGKIREMLDPRYIHYDFLFYFFVKVFAFGSSDYKTCLMASVFLMALIRTIKYYTAFIVIKSYLKTSLYHKLFYKIPCALLFVAFAFPLPFNLNKLYIGQISPNIWHNPIPEFQMPFALLLFWCSFEFFEKRRDKRQIFLIIMLLIFNISIKPNFAICFISAFPLFSLVYYREVLLKTILISIFGCSLVLLQSHYLFDGNYVSGVIYAPFLVFKNFSDNYFLSMFVSFAFPLSAFLFYFKQYLKEKIYLYNILFLFIGLAMFFLFAEPYPFTLFGRLGWQLMPIMFILFVSTMMIFLRLDASMKRDKYLYWFVVFFLLLHFFSGVFYLYNYFNGKSYY